MLKLAVVILLVSAIPSEGKRRYQTVSQPDAYIPDNGVDSTTFHLPRPFDRALKLGKQTFQKIKKDSHLKGAIKLGKETIHKIEHDDHIKKAVKLGKETLLKIDNKATHISEGFGKCRGLHQKCIPFFNKCCGGFECRFFNCCRKVKDG